MFSLDIFCERYFHYERMSNFVGCERINKLPYAIIYNSFRRRRLPIAFFFSVCYIIQKELRKKTDATDRIIFISLALWARTTGKEMNITPSMTDRPVLRTWWVAASGVWLKQSCPLEKVCAEAIMVIRTCALLHSGVQIVCNYRWIHYGLHLTNCNGSVWSTNSLSVVFFPANDHQTSEFLFDSQNK